MRAYRIKYFYKDTAFRDSDIASDAEMRTGFITASSLADAVKLAQIYCTSHDSDLCGVEDVGFALV